MQLRYKDFLFLLMILLVPILLSSFLFGLLPTVSPEQQRRSEQERLESIRQQPQLVIHSLNPTLIAKDFEASFHYLDKLILPNEKYHRISFQYTLVENANSHIGFVMTSTLEENPQMLSLTYSIHTRKGDSDEDLNLAFTEFIDFIANYIGSSEDQARFKSWSKANFNAPVAYFVIGDMKIAQESFIKPKSPEQNRRNLYRIFSIEKAL